MCLGGGVCGGGWICSGSGGLLVGDGDCGGGGICGVSGGVYMGCGACGAGCDVFSFIVRLLFLGGWLVDEARGGGGIIDVFRLFCLLCLFRLFGVLVSACGGCVVRGGVCMGCGTFVGGCRVFRFAVRLVALACGIVGEARNGGDGLGVFRLSCLFRVSLGFWRGLGCEICASVS
jgi:hypothetical protein